jgi:hydrogenase maturation protein HypF
MPSFHLHYKGIVQGVGFRPFVLQKATQEGFAGWGKNTFDGVHIEIRGEETQVRKFHQEILAKPPVLARITHSSIQQIGEITSEKFSILNSEGSGKRDLLITPDVAVCTDCLKELNDPKNRRYHYPFITCTNCGPRFSIMHNLPYDRERTTMESFQMCERCEHEYHDPLQRRHFSQTNSCPDCRISLSCYKQHGERLDLDQDGIFSQIIRDWKGGKIVAIKGIGGYLLTCDATNEKAIWTLRNRKLRPRKPFALMYPSIEILEKDAWISDKAKEELLSTAAPIVLLPMHKHLVSGLAVDLINPDLERMGAMLPYAPLYKLLLDRFGKPIIATSGNLSGSPIIYEDHLALRELDHIADTIVMNDRDIAIPQDDSVISFADVTQERIILRRSRGLAPTLIDPEIRLPSRQILAMGADLKSVFTILHEGNIYISQYMGDLDSFLSQMSFDHTLEHFQKLLDFQPEVLLMDKHPFYYSATKGKDLSEQWNIPSFGIQHHKAHFAAVLGEHHLLDEHEKVLGVIWDGMGFGEDEAIWGGEWFTYSQGKMERCYHLPYYSYLLNDKMSKEPRLSALSLLKDHPEKEKVLRNHFDSREWEWYNRILEERQHIQTSSMGRLFDAASCLLTGIDKMDFQGEAAMHLEQLARHYFYKHNPEHRLTYLKERFRDPAHEILSGIIDDLKREKDPEFIAARFHISLVDMIFIVGRRMKISKMAFSGGVFQNALLVDLIKVLAKEDLQLYFHRELSPNDESIAFGQLMYYGMDQENIKLMSKSEEQAP